MANLFVSYCICFVSQRFKGPAVRIEVRECAKCLDGKPTQCWPVGESGLWLCPIHFHESRDAEKLHYLVCPFLSFPWSVSLFLG